jgi:hypothetical protein
MATMYTDRVLVTFNGVNIFPPGDMASFSITRTGNAAFVNGMTTSGNASGGVKGNTNNTLRFTQYVQNIAAAAPIDFSIFDYELNNVQITIAASSNSYGTHAYNGETFVFSGVFYMEQEMAGAGTGQSVTRTYVFGATNIVEVI